jgi:hypothetical protein
MDARPRRVQFRAVVGQVIVFASTCPTCKREQSQDGYTLESLHRLLQGGYPIEAYCTICNEFWSISLQKRVELGERVAAAGEGRAPPELE